MDLPLSIQQNSWSLYSSRYYSNGIEYYLIGNTLLFVKQFNKNNDWRIKIMEVKRNDHSNLLGAKFYAPHSDENVF